MKITTEYCDTVIIDTIEIKSANYIGNFVIKIEFNDGVCKNVDFKTFLKQALHPSIKQYFDETKFHQFVIKDGNLNWNNYELIFPLEDLYNGKITL